LVVYRKAFAKCCRRGYEETYSEYAEGIRVNKNPSRRQHKQVLNLRGKDERGRKKGRTEKGAAV
jgi:hypothetical protein